MRNIVIVPAALVLLAASLPSPFQFEPEPQALSGRSPKIAVRRQHGLFLLTTEKGDLMFRTSQDLGDTFSEPVRVNNVPKEISDHGENSPQLLLSPDENTIYAVWNSRDPGAPMASHVRFSRANAMMPQWSPAVTVDDDPKPNSHSFQSAAVAPDGTIYVAWLDGRDRTAETAGMASIYMTRSTDGGKTWAKNVRVAERICPCCRLSFAFLNGRVYLAWRQVDEGDIRDIYLAYSADQGETWSKPREVARDGWKINGCPHVGPALATLNNKLYVAWFSEGGEKPAIYLASSADGGETFSPKQMVSVGTTDPTHPQLAATESKLALTFQARDANQSGGWGKMGVYYREIYPTGKLSPLVRVAEPKTSAKYPAVALGLSGRIFLSWTEGDSTSSQAYLLRGRAR
jgi:hypothetical protein